LAGEARFLGVDGSRVNLKGVERNLARMLHSRGDLGAGRYLLAPIYTWFTMAWIPLI